MQNGACSLAKQALLTRAQAPRGPLELEKIVLACQALLTRAQARWGRRSKNNASSPNSAHQHASTLGSLGLMTNLLDMK